VTQDIADRAVDPHPEEADDSIRAAFQRLIADGRAYAQAEAEKQKLKAGIVGAAVRDAAILGIVALMLVFAILVALLIGLILALAPQLGIGWAIGAVLSSALVVTLVLLLLAKARIGRMRKALKP
jgi:hypothetical protein